MTIHKFNIIMGVKITYKRLFELLELKMNEDIKTAFDEGEEETEEERYKFVITECFNISSPQKYKDLDLLSLTHDLSDNEEYIAGIYIMTLVADHFSEKRKQNFTMKELMEYQKKAKILLEKYNIEGEPELYFTQDDCGCCS